MSSYFDEMAAEVSEANMQHVDGDQFIDELKEIEARLFTDVSAVTGDREFPEDIRERAMGVLAVYSVFQPGKLPVPSEAVEVAKVFRYSRTILEMHDLFHELARRRVVTRFGVLSDNPRHILALRDDHDGK